METKFSPEKMKKYGVKESELRLATEEEKQSADRMRPSVSYWKDALRRFWRNKLGVVMLILLVCILLAAILVPELSPYSYKAQSKELRQGPSWSHPFGTDKLGRDILVRVMWGTRISLIIGFVTMILVCIIGITYGGISAYAGGWTDNIMMRIVDFMMSVPSMLIIILLSVVLRDPMKSLLSDPRFSGLASIGAGLLSMFLVLGLFNWLGMARTVRGALMTNRTAEFVLSAEAMGGKRGWVLKKHLLPNAIGVIIISATGVVPGAIMTESFLSFIGLGVSAPMPSLGYMASDALNGMQSYPLNLVWPTAMICLITLSFNIVGDALRDALDPRMRK